MSMISKPLRGRLLPLCFVGTVLFSALATGGCGGGTIAGSSGSGGGVGGPPPPPPPATSSPAGIWEGSVVFSGQLAQISVLGFALSDGRFRMALDDGTQWVGNLVVDENIATSNFDIAYPVGFGIPTISTPTQGTLEVEITDADAIFGQVVLRSQDGEEISGDLDLAYNPLHGVTSDIGSLAGIYETSPPPVVESPEIDASGNFFSVNAQNGCTANATIVQGDIPLPFNIYTIELSYSSCTGDASNLNGVGFAGLGGFIGDEQLAFTMTGETAGESISIVLRYLRISQP